MSATRVLIVDDSATVRAVLKRVLSAGESIEVVGEAADGRDAISQAELLVPDAIVMDLDLPGVDGISATEEIFRKRPTPVLVVTSKLAGRDEILRAFGTLQRGVVGIFPKPTTPARWEELGRSLVETVQQLRVSGFGGAERQESPTPQRVARLKRRINLIAIGASTGGPGAICELLQKLGRPIRPAVCIVQHIADGFDLGLAQWLGHELRADVRLAQDGEKLCAGMIRVAPADKTLRFDAEGVQLLAPILDKTHSPSIDATFESLTAWSPRETAAVLLSGMGRDGVAGMRALREAGALTVAQDESSSAVFGMPNVALREGAAELSLSPGAIGSFIRSITEEVSNE